MHLIYAGELDARRPNSRRSLLFVPAGTMAASVRLRTDRVDGIFYSGVSFFPSRPSGGKRGAGRAARYRSQAEFLVETQGSSEAVSWPMWLRR
jgi:hypothetical protein